LLETALALADALARLDSHFPEADTLCWEDVSAWGDRVVAWLERAGILSRVSSASSLACDACDDGHIEEVISLGGGPAGEPVAYILCPSHGPVAVDEEYRRRWRVRLDGFTSTITQALGLTPGVQVLEPDRLVLLGTAALDGRSVQAFLARGLHWTDASRLAAAVHAASGSLDAIVFVPLLSPASVPERTAIVPLAGALSLSRGRLALRMPELRPRVAVATTAPTNEFRRSGATWLVSFAGAATSVPDCKGMWQIAGLLAYPHSEISAIDLARGAYVPSFTVGAANAVSAGLRVAKDRKEAPLIDSEARKALRRNVRELQEEMRDAEEIGDDDRVEKTRREIEQIEDYVRTNTGLGGRARRSRSPNDRAREAVTKAIRSAIRRMEPHHPTLAAHLSLTIRTGRNCSYRPNEPIPWRL
jgi:hypothetical protein